MGARDREQIYFALYALFNNQGLEYDIPQTDVYDVALEKALEEQNFEFATILRDFRAHFNNEF